MDTKELTRAWMEVDLDAIRRNAQRLAARAKVPIIAMLKADAYGLGSVEVARALSGEPNIWGFGIATTVEGRALRDAGISGRLFCVTPVLADELAAMHVLDITPTLFRERDIVTWASLGADGRLAPWHLMIDTGLNRAGVQWDDAATLTAVLAQYPPEGVLTHFYASELHELSRDVQAVRFRQAINACGVQAANPNVLLHAENSLGVAARNASAGGSPYHLARPGIALHGWPSQTDLQLEPVVAVRARVVDVRTVPAGGTVSYGATWVAPNDAQVATISIGYADGYRRGFSNSSVVVINGTRCPVVGIVTMDMTMVNVTDIRCEIGDAATLIDGAMHPDLSLDAIATLGDVSPYELLVGLKLRLHRVYSGRSEIHTNIAS